MNKRQDLFQEYLEKKDKNQLVQNALTDRSYKAFMQNGVKGKNKQQFEKAHSIGDNQKLATLGDAVIRLCYCDLLFGKEKMSEDKKQYESDKVLVEKVARHYDLIKYIDRDTNDKKIPVTYEYEENQHGHKYIATAVEAMVGAIYKDKNRDLKPIIKLLKSWMDF